MQFIVSIQIILVSTSNNNTKIKPALPHTVNDGFRYANRLHNRANAQRHVLLLPNASRFFLA